MSYSVCEKNRVNKRILKLAHRLGLHVVFVQLNMAESGCLDKAVYKKPGRRTNKHVAGVKQHDS